MSELKVRMEAYQKLQVENKTLKMELELCADKTTEQAMQIHQIQQSMDELSESVCSFRIHLQRYHPEERHDLLKIINEKIQKAQTIKESLS